MARLSRQQHPVRVGVDDRLVHGHRSVLLVSGRHPRHVARAEGADAGTGGGDRTRGPETVSRVPRIDANTAVVTRTPPETVGFATREIAMRNSMPTVTVLVVLLSLMGCATGSQETAPPIYNPEFDFNAPETTDAANAEPVSFALVSTQYGPEEMSEYGGPFRDFARATQAEFQELLHERGYTVSGPFDSYRIMTYPQRADADLVLVPVLDVTVATVNVASQYEPAPLLSLETEGNYTLSGTERLSGQVTLALRESVTGERMWFKTIDLPTKRVTWDTYTGLSEGQAERVLSYGENVGAFYSRNDDPGYINPVSKTLEDYYQVAMEVAWDYLNPTEMAHLKERADELKASYSPGR